MLVSSLFLASSLQALIVFFIMSLFCHAATVEPATLSATASSAALSSSALEQARHLQPPVAMETEHGETEGAEFWEAHSVLLKQAWKEWEESQSSTLPAYTNLNDLLDPRFKVALRAAWAYPEPQEEDALRDLWTKVAPGVYQAQLLNPDQIDQIRQILDAAATTNSGIPFRRPNAMNRYGMILESSIDGAVTVSRLTSFYQELVAHVVRPVGRMLFSEYFAANEPENDAESYAFTIRYKQGEDVSLKEHSDASLITLNVNLNRPGEEVQYHDPVKQDGNGTDNNNNINSQQQPSLYVVDDTNGVRHNLTFAPGMAVLHRGMTRHGAYPIQGGERTNLVVWLFGPHGYVRIKPYAKSEQMTRNERWQLGALQQQQQQASSSSSLFHNNNDRSTQFDTQEL